MSRVKKSWVLQNVSEMWGFGGQYNKEDFKSSPTPKGGFESTLTKEGIDAVTFGERVNKFHILVPNIGWVDCIPNS